MRIIGPTLDDSKTTTTSQTVFVSSQYDHNVTTVTTTNTPGPATIPPGQCTVPAGAVNHNTNTDHEVVMRQSYQTTTTTVTTLSYGLLGTI